MLTDTIMHLFFSAEALSHFSVLVSLQQGFMEGSLVTNKFCRYKMQRDLAILTIELDSLEVQKVVRAISVNDFDRLGYIGGSLGLFNGFSLYVLAELVFWLSWLIFNILRSAKAL